MVAAVTLRLLWARSFVTCSMRLVLPIRRRPQSQVWSPARMLRLRSACSTVRLQWAAPVATPSGNRLSSEAMAADSSLYPKLLEPIFREQNFAFQYIVFPVNREFGYCGIALSQFSKAL